MTLLIFLKRVQILNAKKDSYFKHNASLFQFKRTYY